MSIQEDVIDLTEWHQRRSDSLTPSPCAERKRRLQDVPHGSSSEGPKTKLNVPPRIKPTEPRERHQVAQSKMARVSLSASRNHVDAVLRSQDSRYGRCEGRRVARQLFKRNYAEEAGQAIARDTQEDDVECDEDSGVAERANDSDSIDSDESWDNCSKDEAREASRHAANRLNEISSSARLAILDALVGHAAHGLDHYQRKMDHNARKQSIIDALACGCTSVKTDYRDSVDDLARSASFSALKDYQRVGVRWLLALHSCVPGMVLADEMGLGKTLQSLCFLEVIASDKPSLVVAPASILDNWVAEAARWTPKLRTLKYHASKDDFAGRQALREAFFAQGSNYRLVITSPQVLHGKDDQVHFFRRIHFEYLIYDEAHCLKTITSNLYRDLNNVVKCNKRLLLTGTPIQNSLYELATLLGFALSCDGDMEVPRYLHAISMKPLARALRQLQAVSGPLILRRLKSDVLHDLPAKRCIVVYCDLNAQQQALYDEEMEASRSKRHDDDGSLMDAFRKLRRVCLHPLLCKNRLSDVQSFSFVDHLMNVSPYFRTMSRARVEDDVHGWNAFDVHRTAVQCGLPQDFRLSEDDFSCSAKLTELIRILRQQSATRSKTLVFSQFVMLLDITEVALKNVGIACFRLDGTTAIEERHSLVSSFQDPGGPLVLLATTKTGGVGLTLTAANVVVMLDLDFNPQNGRQAEDRAHRIGQASEVTVYYLICRDTVEEMMLRRSLRKMQLDATFGGSRAALELTDAGGTDEADGKRCEKFVLAELNELLKRPPRVQFTVDREDDLPLTDFAQLPEDACPGHIAYSRVRREGPPKNLVRFQFHMTGKKIPCQVTVGQAGSWHSAEVIARACFLRFEQGWSQEQVNLFKKQCLDKISSARTTVTNANAYDQKSMAAPQASVKAETAKGLPNSIVDVATQGVAWTPQSCDRVTCNVDGEIDDPIHDSDTGTECMVVCQRPAA